MPHFPLSCFPTPCCRLQPLVRPGVVQKLGLGPLLLLSMCPTQLLQHGLFHGSSSHWILYLPWTCLSFFSVPCPFLNTFPWRHPNLTWLVQFWSTVGQFFLRPRQVSAAQGNPWPDKAMTSSLKQVSMLSLWHAFLFFYLLVLLLLFWKIIFYFLLAWFTKSL